MKAAMSWHLISSHRVLLISSNSYFFLVPLLSYLLVWYVVCAGFEGARTMCKPCTL